jgi:hypothetical protein
MGVPKNCKKCNRTGFLNWTTVDGGRCWNCTGLADTGTAHTLPTLGDDEAAARWAAHVAELRTARRARRAA